MKTPEEQIKAIKAALSKNNPAPMFTFEFGKHEGKTLKEVACGDPRYLIWLRNKGFRFNEEILRFIGSLSVDK